MDGLAEFKRHTFFQGVPETILESLVEQSRWLRARTNQIIISHTEPTTDIYALMSGTLTVQIFAENGKTIFFREIGPGELVGELSAIDNRPRSASVVALSNSLVAVVPAKAFWEVLRAHSLLMEQMLVSLSQKVREMTDQVFELTALDVQSRIIAELCRIGGQSEQEFGTISIKPAPTHETIANHVGTTREAVTRTLSGLEQEGLISRSRREIIINDIGKLSRLVSQ